MSLVSQSYFGPCVTCGKSWYCSVQSDRDVDGCPHCGLDDHMYLPVGTEWTDASVFYRSKEWKQLRLEVIEDATDCGRVTASCAVCHAELHRSKSLHVDHIIPRSARPDLAMSRANLRILCRQCNEGKGSQA